MVSKRGNMKLELQGNENVCAEKWLRERDSNPRPLAYETNELPDCSIPQ